jgi:putative MATE family efflux protein
MTGSLASPTAVISSTTNARPLSIWRSLCSSCVESIPLALLGFSFAGPLMSIFGLAPDVARIGAAYLQVAMGTVVVLVALVALVIGGGILRGAGDSRTPMLVTLIANVVNVGISYGLIYGRFGLPALGAVGSAWAAFLSRSIALLLLLRVLWVGRNGISIAGSAGWRPNWRVARQVLDLGIPTSLEQLLFSAGLLVLTILVAQLGTETLAAQRIAISALSFSFLPSIAFGLAATALVGQSIGARQPGVGAGVAHIATRWALIWMSAIGSLILIFAPAIMRLFSSDPAVIGIGAGGLRVMALTQPFWAINMVRSGALRGTGDTRFPLIISALGIWSVVLLVWATLSLIGGGLPAVWAAFLVISPIQAVLTWRRFRRRMRDLAAG